MLMESPNLIAIGFAIVSLALTMWGSFLISDPTLADPLFDSLLLDDPERLNKKRGVGAVIYGFFAIAFVVASVIPKPKLFSLQRSMLWVGVATLPALLWGWLVLIIQDETTEDFISLGVLTSIAIALIIVGIIEVVLARTKRKVGENGGENDDNGDEKLEKMEEKSKGKIKKNSSIKIRRRSRRRN